MNIAAMPSVLQLDADAWALRINARWRQSRENIIETGQLLIDAKKALPHGRFETELEVRLDFSPSVAQRLMAIARDPRLSNPAHVQLLPSNWGTLYELTKLSDEQFEEGIEKHIIRPDMKRKEVELIRPMPHRARQDSDGRTDEAMARESAAVVGVARSQPGGDCTTMAPVQAGMGSERSSPSEAVPMPGGGLAIAHRRVEPDDSRDFFPTPPWATRALFEHVLAHLGYLGPCKYQSVLEPACGQGHMAEVLKEYFPMMIATDVVDYGCGYGVADFLDPDTFTNSDWIITNPPFNDSAEFVLKALALASTGVAMFVRLTWLESVGRYEKIFRDHSPTQLAIFSERVPLHKGRWEEAGTTMTAYVWLVWIKDAEPRAPFWIPPKCRETLTRPEDGERFALPASLPPHDPETGEIIEESWSGSNAGQNRVNGTDAAADGVTSRFPDGRTSDAGAVDQMAASAPIEDPLDLPDFLRWGDEAKLAKGEAA